MKKIVLMLALLMATMTVAANNILYFTYSQAARTVATLNSQNELMIYCGYENELPTYVLINEVWAEQISSSFYEIWLYGYDAYTGEEIYMPIDLECIYLMQNRNIYSAAQYLRFKYTRTRPTFAWAMPPYNPFVRAPRPVTFYYTYHYDIHRPGWHWHLHPTIHYHPYYLRLPGHPAPMPPKPYTPGKEYPGWHQTPQGYQYDNLPLVGRVTAPRSASTVQNNPTGRNGNRITSDRQNNTITVTDRATGRGTTSTAPSRTGVVNEGSTRGSSSSRSGVSTDNGSSRGSSSSRSGISTDNSSSRGSSSSRSGVSTDNSNSRGSSSSRSGVSTDNNNSRGSSSSRSGISTDNGSSRGSSSSRSGISTDNGNSRGSSSSRGGVSTDNSNSRGSSSSRSGISTDNNNSRSNSKQSSATRSSESNENNSRGTTTRTDTRQNTTTATRSNTSSTFRTGASRSTSATQSNSDNNSRTATRSTQSGNRGAATRGTSQRN